MDLLTTGLKVQKTNSSRDYRFWSWGSGRLVVLETEGQETVDLQERSF